MSFSGSSKTSADCDAMDGDVAREDDSRLGDVEDSAGGGGGGARGLDIFRPAVRLKTQLLTSSGLSGYGGLVDELLVARE